MATRADVDDDAGLRAPPAPLQGRRTRNRVSIAMPRALTRMGAGLLARHPRGSDPGCDIDSSWRPTRSVENARAW